MTNVLAVNVPVMSYGRTPVQITAFYKEAMRRISELPGVERVAIGTVVPWRDAGAFGPGFQFTVEGYAKADGEEDPRARFRTVSPGFFDSIGVPIIGGRDFSDADRRDADPVVIVSQSLAQRMFPNQDAVNRRLLWTDPVMQFIDVSTKPRRIVGIAADVDDENIVPGPALAVYHPFDQENRRRTAVRARRHGPLRAGPAGHADHPRLSADQPVERAATLADVRAEVLAPDRLNALVFGGFATVALVIAVVGVAGVLAFSVSARTREFGIRLAVGSSPHHLLTRVLGEARSSPRRASSPGRSAGSCWRARSGVDPGRPRAGRAADRRRRVRAGRGGDPRVADAGGARLSSGRHPGVAIRMTRRSGRWRAS
jgi:hypothetical protein